jgi:hypothetical protein
LAQLRFDGLKFLLELLVLFFKFLVILFRDILALSSGILAVGKPANAVCKGYARGRHEAAFEG